MHLSPEYAGSVILIGQITDGIATPIVGILADKTPVNRLGKRTLWYITGFIMQATFSFFFFNPEWIKSLIFMKNDAT